MFRKRRQQGRGLEDKTQDVGNRTSLGWLEDSKEEFGRKNLER